MRSFVKIAWLGLALNLSAGTAGAEAKPIAFTLRPPKIEVKPVCAVKEPIASLRKRWEAFDTAALKGLKTEQLRTIVGRLISYDAAANFEVAEKLLRHLMATKDRVAAAQYASDLAKLYIEANRLDRNNAKELLPLIERGPLAGSPNNLYLSGLIYQQGQAVSRDLDKAFSRFFAAAQAGNPDALLKLAVMRQAGLPQAKDVDAALSITLAINALLADRTPVICDRIKHIARMYSKGDYVEQNDEIAAEWSRLAADFGDAEAAWNLARMHLRSEIIVKDNGVLIKYMTLAAERGVVPAMIELATIYLDGSLADADPEKSEYWYTKASDAGSVSALVHLADYYERQGSGEARRKVETILRKIALRADAPAHALVALAKIELENSGNIAGRAAAMPLLERAAKLGDPDAQLAVAKLGVGAIVDRPTFRRVASQMETAAATGSSDAMLSLSSLYVCHDPLGPDIANATIWRERALGAGNKRVELDQLFETGAAGPDAKSRIAMLRSNALSGSSDALAYLINAYGNNAGKMGGNEAAEFWRARLASDASAMWRYAKLVSTAPETRKLMQDAVNAGSVTAKIDLAKLLIETGGSSDPALAKVADGLLVETAMQGRGESLEILRERMAAQSMQSMMKDGGLREVIEARGDYRAFIVAARLSASAAERKDLLASAAVLADCSFDGALRMAKAYSEFGQPADAVRWARIAGALTGTGGSNPFRLAEFYRGIGPRAFATQIDDLLNRAAKAGHGGAMLRLLRASADRSSPDFNRKKAMMLAESMSASKDPKALHMVARVLAGAEDDNPRYANESRDILRRASELGYPPAMRDYGIELLRDTKNGETSMAAGIDWLTRAAGLGDAKAMVELARAFAVGLGVGVSKEKAKELLRNAQKLGNDEAAGMLLSLAGT